MCIKINYTNQYFLQFGVTVSININTVAIGPVFKIFLWKNNEGSKISIYIGGVTHHILTFKVFPKEPSLLIKLLFWELVRKT